MKNILIIIFIIILIGLVAAGFYFFKKPVDNKNIISENRSVSKIHDGSFLTLAKNMKIKSRAFEEGEKIPSKYTCDGENINPPLEISEVPGNAKSLVLIMDDPDAVKPAGKVWDHWLVWNIPPSTTEILEGREPEGVHGKGTAGNKEYYGPCPPDAEHRYFFKIYALDNMLDIPEGSTKAVLEKAMEGHIIDMAELIGRYQR